MRLGLLATASVAMSIFCAANPASAQVKTFDIPAQDAVTAVPVFGTQAGLQIVAPARLMKGKRTHAIKGAMPVDAALREILKGTGLTIASRNGTTVVLTADPAAPPAAPAAKPAPAAPASDRRHETAADPVLGEVVVVATRRAQSPLTTPAPVDVVSGGELAARGNNDIAKKLVFLTPSFNYTEAQGLVTAVGTRPASLRGMGIDQVLVLVNGHRRHASAVLDTNNGFGRGTVPVDLNAIPADAIERIEILRDGASAQYGSDAIAGVINIVLRGDKSGGLISGQAGITEKGDGASGIFTMRRGFELGDGGFLTATAEVRTHGATNFAGVDTRVGRRTLRIGEPDSTDVDLTLNAERPVSWGALYGDFTFFRRYTQSFGGAFRLPNIFPVVYPNGFLPGVNQETYDFGGTLGARGAAGAWRWDLSDTIGYDRAAFDAFDTANRSLGPTTPTRFNVGAEQYLQNLVNLTFTRDFELLAGAHLTLGAEHRYEQYKLIPGEPASYIGEGATGFPGFNPPTPVNPSRNALSAFADGSLSLAKGLDLGLAGRFEHYSDFGSHATGKASVFWKPTDVIAFRSTLSTGIRAPSLQQQSYASNSSQFVTPTPANPTGLVIVRNAAVDDPIARLLGATPLKPEKSRNVSAGIVLTPFEGLSATADYFHIRIDDRIAYSEILQGPLVNAVLAANGVTNANTVRFFTNALDTKTDGYELAVHWVRPLDDTSRLSLNLAYANFANDIVRVRRNPVLPTLPLLAARSLLVITSVQPKNKWTFNGNLSWGRANLTVDVVRFGHWEFIPIGTFEKFSPEWQLNLGASYDVTDSLRLQAGVINAANNYPDRIVDQVDGRLYESAGGLGVDGREYYVRATKSF
jgi:iron complex outermembrane receptor protein